MSRTCTCLLLFAMLAVVLNGPALAAEASPEPASAPADRLDLPYPVDWRSVSLRTVLDGLSHELNVPYQVDSATPAEAMERRIRLYATHLTGRQAFRWAARLAGLEAVVRDGIALVAPSGRLPLAWRFTGAAAPDEEHAQALAQRRISITWIDTPLSAVARDISAKLGIDVVFHPEVLAQEGLIHLERSEASLDVVRAALEEQLKAKAFLYDNALWVTPPGQTVDEPVTRPFMPPLGPRPTSAIGPGPLDQFVVVDRSVDGWREFCDRISRAAGVGCRVSPPGASFGAPVEARGTVGEVLEAARLLGRLEWRFSTGGRGTAGIEIRPGPGER